MMSLPRAGELHGMILNTLSIDEYESKLGKEQQVIVVAFEVKSEDAGIDVRDFIQRGTSTFIDAEVSPAPTEELNWVVFVEFKRDSEFWGKLEQVVDEVERLNGDSIDWDVYTYFSNKVFKLDSEKLRHFVSLTPADYLIRKYKKKKRELSEDISDFFKESLVEKVEYNGGNVIIHSRIKNICHKLVAFDDTSKILENNVDDAINILGISLDEEILRKTLGESYSVNSTKTKIYIQHKGQDKILVLKKYG